jgi:hypothetical protein
MTPEEFRALTTRVAQNLDNQALVTELLTQAADTYTQNATSIDNLNKQVGEYEGKVKQLQDTNMNLFLRLGNQTPEPQRLNDPDPLKYDDLITSLGGK